MNELIKVESRVIGVTGEIQTVNARELHGFLKVKSEFRNWIKNRVEDFGFVDGQDFTTFGKNLPTGGRQTDYHITLDMAKELAMVERSEQGKQARQYFIECERRLKAAAPHAVPQSLPEALRLAADLAEKNAQQALLIDQQKPAVEFVEKYAEAESTKGLSDVAKVLGFKPHTFPRVLEADGVIFKRNSVWVPTQFHIDAGRFVVRLGVRHGFAFNQIRVTPKGELWLSRKYGA